MTGPYCSDTAVSQFLRGLRTWDAGYRDDSSSWHYCFTNETDSVHQKTKTKKSNHTKTNQANPNQPNEETYKQTYKQANKQNKKEQKNPLHITYTA